MLQRSKLNKKEKNFQTEFGDGNFEIRESAKGNFERSWMRAK